jgi:sulfur carrier protein
LQDRPLKLSVNGEMMDVCDVRTVGDLLARLKLGAASGGPRVAVAVNLDVVPRAEHATRALVEGDKVEIIHAVGGG